MDLFMDGGRSAAVLRFLIAQAILFTVFLRDLTAETDHSQGWVIVEGSLLGSEMTFRIAGFLIYTLVLALLSTLAGLLVSLVRKSLRTPRSRLHSLRLAVLAGLPVIAFLTMLLAYSVFSWFFGDGCIPIYGGSCDEKEVLPYVLFYASSALSLLVYLRVVLRFANRTGGRTSTRRRVK